MSSDVFVHLLPELVELERLRGGVAVVVDVLRASTTIVHSLAAGARAVVPFERVDQARAYAERAERGSVALAGERGGVLIEGFDLDNSPYSCTPQSVGGKTVAFTTTNGTRALLHCREADRVLVGAFVNLNAVAAEIARSGRPVHVVCAGTRGRITSEDVLFAGALATEIGATRRRDDVTQMAVDHYAAHAATDASLLAALRASAGGRDLIDLGFDRDVECAAARNTLAIVPEYFTATGECRAIGAI